MPIRPILRLLRPWQWSKNLVCFAGAVFGGHLSLHDWIPLRVDAVVFALFCAASSGVYICNDIADRERDRLHPLKRQRPLASGTVGLPLATTLALLLIGGALAGAFTFHISVGVCVLLYLLVNTAYTHVLKHQVLLDVICIAFGFIFRLLSGIYPLGDIPTAWIVLCSFFLALFLGFAKRSAELYSIEADQIQTRRPVLLHYTEDFLNFLLSSAATMTVLCYAVFTTNPNTKPTLAVTIPIVYYGIMRYKRLVMVRKLGEEPERLLYKDPGIALSILVWLAVYVLVLYGDFHLLK